MTRLKLTLLASACALFALACATNTVTNTGTATNTNRAATNANAAANGGSTNAPAAVTDPLAEARASYNAACVKCHKENGEGGTVDIDGDKLRVPSFKGGHALKHSDEGYFKQISEGGEGMPKFKDRLTPAQINGLVHFIRSEFQAGLTAGGAANANSNK
jgi:mono/diheme cytochrome c family protein